MVCVAFERFCAVWLPHQNKILFTHRKVSYIVLCIALTSTLLSTWFIFVVKMMTKTRSTFSKTPFKFVIMHFPHFILILFCLEIHRRIPFSGNHHRRIIQSFTIKNVVSMMMVFMIRWVWYQLSSIISFHLYLFFY